MDGWTNNDEALEQFDELVYAANVPLKPFIDTLQTHGYLDKSPNSLLLVLLGQAMNAYMNNRSSGKTPYHSFQAMTEYMSTNPLLAQLMLMGGANQ